MPLGWSSDAPSDLEHVNRFGPKLGPFDAFRHRRTLRRLRRRLKQEPVLATVAGNGLRGEGLLALTPTRILWVTRRGRTFHLDQLKGLRVATDGDQGIITLEQPGLELAVARIQADAAVAFADAAKQAARDAGNRSIESRKVDPRPTDAPELGAEAAKVRLERLERMLERGSITYPEYLSNRRRIQQRAEPPPDPPSSSWWRRF